ncbi:MAG: hypothetical protein KGI11_08785 [Thaumarchaeota archaeon]|nr:hypothetical protein [Nitrososphaerota archaeon]
MSLYIINDIEAKMIATNFVQQHYSVMKIEKPHLKDEVWHVKVSTSSPKYRDFEIKINSKTGHVIGF